MNYYILDKDHNLKQVSLEEFGTWFSGEKNRVVKQEDIGKDYWVSTVFLGIDHGFGDEGLWFETMVFKKDKNGEIDFSELDMDRYTTYEQALKGHKVMVKKWKNKFMGR